MTETVPPPPPPPPPFPANAIDDNVQGLIGRKLDRLDGRLKVTGQARYAYEYAGAGEALYGFVVGASIARGAITELITTAAEAAPGVVLVLTHRNVATQPAFVPNDMPMPEVKAGKYARPRPFLADRRISYLGEPIALVVAESFEAARAAAALVEARYDAAPPRADLAGAQADAYKPQIMNGGYPPDSSRGDFAAAFAAAPVTIDVVYNTPAQHHCAMEPHSTTALWDKDGLTVHSSAQLPVSSREAIARTAGLPIDKVRVIAKFIGGGFGGKGTTEADAILAVHATCLLRRPVKVAMTRQQTFVNSEHRPAAIQRIRLAATHDGRLLASGHDVVEETATHQEFAEQTAVCSRSLYATLNCQTSHRLVRLNLPAPGTMRAPGEAPGLLAYEAAFDELAHALAIDPIELRLRNEPQRDPESGRPFSTRNLVSCLREGAAQFGWKQRAPTPGARREGDWLVGMGVAAAFRPNFMVPARAQVRIDAAGRINVATAMTDLGTGTYTILAQIAAEALAAPIAQVEVEIGDSALPPALGSAGSVGAASSGSAVLDACSKLKARLALAAGASNGEVRVAGGHVHVGERAIALEHLLAGAPFMAAEGAVMPGPEQRAFSHAAYGAQFAEVGVDSVTGEVRLRRMLGVFAAGRILNEKTARSQVLGAMVGGVSAALLEASMIDGRSALIVNHDLAEYHVPTHADAVQMDARFIAEPGDAGNPLRIKGLGELGICGAGAAVNNAVFNATGVRVRDYPITLDKLIAGLPALGAT